MPDKKTIILASSINVPEVVKNPVFRVFSLFLLKNLFLLDFLLDNFVFSLVEFYTIGCHGGADKKLLHLI